MRLGQRTWAGKMMGSRWGKSGGVEKKAAADSDDQRCQASGAPTPTSTATSPPALACCPPPQPAMSSLPRSIGARLLAPALRPSVSAASRATAPRMRPYATDDAPAVPLQSDSTQIREQDAAAGMRHQPDYNVAIDYRTSCVAARPSRI